MVLTVPMGLTCDYGAMGLSRGMRSSARARWGLLVVTSLALLVTGVVVLALWPTPSARLAGLRELRLTDVIPVVSLAVTIVGLVWQVRLRRLERRDDIEAQRRARDRTVMLKRVRHRWITSVLEQSLARETRIRLGLMRRPDAVWQRDMVIRRRGRDAERLPAGTLVSTVFDEVGGGLLILGAPGSGKTTALLELARDLLKDAEADRDAPMPVVFNLSSWAARPFGEWLIGELHTRYDVPRTIAERWVARGEILPLLDGLDEVDKAHRTGCVEAINAFQREHGLARVVVCSRTEEYTELATLLRVEDAVELQPVTRQQVWDYLEAAGSALVDVRAVLKADETLWGLLQSPLVLSIVALTYRGRSADALRASGTPEQRLTLLFEAYTERMLEHRPGRYTPAQMRHWLAWLARLLRDRSQSEFHLELMQPDWLPSRKQQWIVTRGVAWIVGLVTGVATGITLGLGAVEAEKVYPGGIDPLLTGLMCGLVAALCLGLFVGQAAYEERIRPAESLSWSWAEARARRASGVVAGLACGLATGLALGLTFNWVVGLVAGLACGLAVDGLIVLAGGLSSQMRATRTIPNEGMRTSRRNAIRVGLATGTGIGLLAGVIFGAAFTPVVGLSIGAAVGVAFGLAVGLNAGGGAVLRHLALRILLVRNDFAPLRYVCFLNDATERLFLRRSGSSYLFVHRLLLEYFAELGTAYISRESSSW